MKRTSNRTLIGALFIVAGINHFVMPRMYMSIMPDYLPRPRLLVLLSGIAEIISGIFALCSRLRRWARWSLIAVLLGVFPANLHMAVHAERYASIPAWLLWLRLPLQGALIGWVWWSTEQNDH